MLFKVWDVLLLNMHSFELVDLIPEKQFKRSRFWSRLIYIVSAVILSSLFLYHLYELYTNVPGAKYRWIIYIFYFVLLGNYYQQALHPKQVRNKFLVSTNSITVDQQYEKGFTLSWSEVVKVQMNFSAIRLFTDSNHYQEFDSSKLDSAQKQSLRKIVYTIAQEKQIPIEIPSAIKDNLLH